MAILEKVRYTATTPSKAPVLHSAMKSARFVLFGVTMSTEEVKEDQTSCALEDLSVPCKRGYQIGAEDILVDGAEKEDFGLGHNEDVLLSKKDDRPT